MIEAAKPAGLISYLSVLIVKPKAMKNEPVVTYNHMEDDDSNNSSKHVEVMEEKNHHPISLYMIFVVDMLLIGGVVYFTIKTIF